MVYTWQLSEHRGKKQNIDSGNSAYYSEIALIIVIYVLVFLSKPNEVKYCKGGFHGSDNVFKNMQVSGICPLYYLWIQR